MFQWPGCVVTSQAEDIFKYVRCQCWHSLTHTIPSCLQVEEEDERKKKDLGRAHEVELLNMWAAAALSFYRQSIKESIYKVWLPQCSAASTTTTSTTTLLQLAATTILNSLCRPRLNGWLDWVHASATSTTRHEKRQAWAWVIIYHFYVCSTSEFPVNLMYKIF